MRLLQLLSLAFCMGLLLAACEKDTSNNSCPSGSTNFKVGDGLVYVPNIFTPNGDGLNDIFIPYVGASIRSIEDFKVVGAGLVLFENSEMSPNNPSGGWSGSTDDKVYIGRFSYSFVAESTDGTKKRISGTALSNPYEPNSSLDWDCTDCRFGTQHNGFGEGDTNLPTYEDICR